MHTSRTILLKDDAQTHGETENAMSNIRKRKRIRAGISYKTVRETVRKIKLASDMMMNPFELLNLLLLLCEPI